MAQPQPVQPRLSLPKQLANFTNSAAGLDLTLRLIHAVSLIAAEVCVDDDTVKKWVIAAAQLGLARRYLRFFSFIECFEHAYELLSGVSPSAGTMAMTMELVQSSCLGMYFLLEDLTMLHDMNIWLVPWYTTVLLEANKFWVYALTVSVIGTVGELFFGPAGQSEVQKGASKTDDKEAKSEAVSVSNQVTSTAALLNRAVVGSLDLTLPTTALGWSGLGNFGVGSAMAVSTVLAWPDAWAKAQR